MAAELTRAGFVELLRDEIGLDLETADLARGLDELPGWDSVQLLAILVLLEKRVDRALSLPDFLDAADLETIYEMVTR
ncbi:phosphopantetheine-binding protein [Actinomadura fulvescens]|uniref:phosphopantetheine-binding protein n=1 Tax=Actinomadura fulvescens TaxID=46160 RepID=UPI0031DD5741